MLKIYLTEEKQVRINDNNLLALMENTVRNLLSGNINNLSQINDAINKSDEAKIMIETVAKNNSSFMVSKIEYESKISMIGIDRSFQNHRFNYEILIKQ